MLQVVVILSLSIWVSACSSTGSINKKPDGALTLPMDAQNVDKEDTPATLLEKFYYNLNQIEDGNLRFQLIRE